MKTRACLTIARWPLDSRYAIAAIWLTLAFCPRATATIFNTYGDWDGNVTQSYLKVAQSFLVPEDNTLASWQFTLAPAAGATNVLFEIVPWNAASGPSGAPLFSRNLSWPTQGGDILVDNINLSLLPDTRYAAVIDLGAFAGKSVLFQFNQNSYNQGNASWLAGSNPHWEYLTSTYNTQFRAEFYTIPEPASLLGLSLISLIFLNRARRSRTIKSS